MQLYLSKLIYCSFPLSFSVLHSVCPPPSLSHPCTPSRCAVCVSLRDDQQCSADRAGQWALTSGTMAVFVKIHTDGVVWGGMWWQEWLGIDSMTWRRTDMLGWKKTASPFFRLHSLSFSLTCSHEFPFHNRAHEMDLSRGSHRGFMCVACHCVGEKLHTAAPLKFWADGWEGSI